MKAPTRFGQAVYLLILEDLHEMCGTLNRAWNKFHGDALSVESLNEVNHRLTEIEARIETARDAIEKLRGVVVASGGPPLRPRRRSDNHLPVGQLPTPKTQVDKY